MKRAGKVYLEKRRFIHHGLIVKQIIPPSFADQPDPKKNLLPIVEYSSALCALPLGFSQGTFIFLCDILTLKG